ncbi:MAG: HAMP domain-containing histidine kinase, partial [Rhodobacteraceae bacterium]|nr:HAMP domain-containing histidine kinase [Paracoccaceae bacterium]
AVAKISHDLRNILTTAQLFADRMESSDDPAVKRAVPKLVSSIRRAVSLCESTLAFGKAEEAPPMLQRVPLAPIVQDVVENESLAAEDGDVVIAAQLPPGMVLRCDPEQLYRVLSNLVRNARQAIAAGGRPGRVTLSAAETDREWTVRVSDTGPGLPAKAREHLFMPFQGGTRKEGSGLGLAIASELVAGHGGRLELERSGPEGTSFVLRLPKTIRDEQIPARRELV